MENIVRGKHSDVEFSEQLLISFAKSLIPEIRKFYKTKAGKEYYEAWLKKHPEYAV